MRIGGAFAGLFLIVDGRPYGWAPARWSGPTGRHHVVTKRSENASEIVDDLWVTLEERHTSNRPFALVAR